MIRWPLISVSAILLCASLHAEGKPATVVSADPKSLDATAEESARATELVRQLGSPSYRDRESASRDLPKIGRLAVPALRAARATESSPEVQRRIELVLPAAEAEDFQARLACFRLDAEGKYEHRLAGWAKLKATLGNDPSVQALFLEVVENKDYENLLAAADRPADELGAVLIAYYQILQDGTYPPSLSYGGKGHPRIPKTSEVALLAFLESLHSDKAMPLRTASNHTSTVNFLNYATIECAMIPGREPNAHAAVLRKILPRWLDSRETGIGLLHALTYSQEWQMPAATARYAAKLLAAGNVYERSYGLEKLGTHDDGAKYLTPIAALIDDASLLKHARPELKDDPNGVLLGDFALGVAILLSGQKHADYGLEVADPAVYARVQPGNYYFKDGKGDRADDHRKAAIKKFRAWMALGKR